MEDSAQVKQTPLVYSPAVLQKDSASPAWAHFKAWWPRWGAMPGKDAVEGDTFASYPLRAQPPVISVAVLKPGKLLGLSIVLQAKSKFGLFSISFASRFVEAFFSRRICVWRKGKKNANYVY